MSDTAPVILVEDNPDDADLIIYAFRKAHVANPVEVISDGETAIRRLAERAAAGDGEVPALILLDLKLPRRTGFEVLAWIRAEDRAKLWPVVVLTSSNQNGDVRRAYELGANSYLVKPVASEALLDMIRTLNRYWIVLNQSPAP
jgi:DNA-binding response OmpR family regulator